MHIRTIAIGIALSVGRFAAAQFPSAPDTGRSGPSLDIAISHVGISLGNSPRHTGFRLNWRDEAVRRVNGVNVTLWRPGPNPFAEINGLADVPIENLVFEKVRIASDSGFSCTDCRGLRLDEAQITPKAGPAFILKNTQRASLSHSCSGGSTECVTLEGERSAEVQSDGVPVKVRR